MILPFFLIFLSLVGTVSALDVQVGESAHLTGVVILVVDGFGASYVYPEYAPYALDGSALDKALLFNLTGDVARVLDVRVPVPETLKSHSVLVTGDPNADPEALGPTIFDQARKKGYLCLALLQRGDTLQILQKQDGVLYFDDNSIPGPGPMIGARESLPEDIRQDLGLWQSRFQDYALNRGLKAYADYNRFELDAAADLVERLGSRPFVLFMNVGGVDSAGQDLGSVGYIQTIQALDAPLGRLAEVCQRNGIVLVVTADHGMSFPAPGKSKGAHASGKYSSRLESLRIPLVVRGPGVDNLSLSGVWSQVNIAPTILGLLGILGNFSESAAGIPLKKSYDLRVTGAKGAVAIYRGEDLVANASGEEITFKGLPRGIYTIKSSSTPVQLCLNGDKMLNLNLVEKSVPGGWLPQDLRKIIGPALILIINLIGVVVIVRIIRKG
ncbi:Metalloenzyme superfamily protein [uncultured archaeon]|nr:Metalloenzyme superfamily protein [uncultured archaeon]